MKTPRELFFAPGYFSKPSKTGTDMYDNAMDVFYNLTAWSSPANPIIKGCRYTDLSQLWHNGDEEPEVNAPCLLDVTFYFEDREPIADFITSNYGKYGWTEGNFARSSNYTIINKWAYIHELMGEKIRI